MEDAKGCDEGCEDAGEERAEDRAGDIDGEGSLSLWSLGTEDIGGQAEVAIAVDGIAGSDSLLLESKQECNREGNVYYRDIPELLEYLRRPEFLQLA